MEGAQTMPPGPTFNGFYDVRVYGASGGGTSDDITYIQQAVDDAVLAGGGTVYFPPGTYLISTAIKVGSEIVLQGNPTGTSADDSLTVTSLILAGQPTGGGGIGGGGTVIGNIMVANSSYTGSSLQENISIRDLNFNGSASENKLADGNAAILFNNVVTVRIERCGIYNCAADAIAITATPTLQTNAWIEDNIIDLLPKRTEGVLTSGNYGVRAQGVAGITINANLIGCNNGANIQWSNDGVHLTRCENVVVTDNQIEYAQNGIACAGSLQVDLSNNTVLNCIGTGVAAYGPELAGSTYVTISSNLIASPTPTIVPPTLAPYGIQVSVDSGGALPPAQYVTVAGNICTGPYTEGAILCNALNSTVADNQVDCMSPYESVSYPSFGISIGQDNSTVCSNTIRQQSGTGTGIAALSVPNAVTGIVIQGNNIDSSSTTPLFLSSLPTQSLICENAGISSYGTISQPLMTVNSSFENPFPFNCTVYLTAAGATIPSVSVNNIVTGYTSALNGNAVCAFQVKCAGTIHIASTGIFSPTWTWVPQ
jgi:parallel beta-helix repeat protein